jgi:hypothetical protein
MALIEPRRPAEAGNRSIVTKEVIKIEQCDKVEMDPSIDCHNNEQECCASKLKQMVVYTSNDPSVIGSFRFDNSSEATGERRSHVTPHSRGGLCCRNAPTIYRFGGAQRVSQRASSPTL